MFRGQKHQGTRTYVLVVAAATALASELQRAWRMQGGGRCIHTNNRLVFSVWLSTPILRGCGARIMCTWGGVVSSGFARRSRVFWCIEASKTANRSSASHRALESARNRETIPYKPVLQNGHPNSLGVSRTPDASESKGRDSVCDVVINLHPEGERKETEREGPRVVAFLSSQPHESQEEHRAYHTSYVVTLTCYEEPAPSSRYRVLLV